MERRRSEKTVDDSGSCKFTKRSIEALTFDGKPRYIKDQDIRGLVVRIGSTTKVFYLRRKVQGRVEYIKLGPFPGITVEQATKRAEELNGAIAAGKNPAEIRRTAKQEMTFGEFWAQYMERYSKVHKRPSSIREDARIYRAHLARFAKRKLSGISKADVRRMHHEVGKRAPVLANRCIAILQSALNVATDWGYFLGVNPAAGIKRYREVERDRFIQADELPRFWQALIDETDRNIVDFVIIALLTGQRRSNIQALRWDEISFDRAEWRIVETKNHEPLTVPLVPEVIRTLRERQTFCPGPWVFPGAGKTGHMVEPKKAWARILKRAGIENLRIHDLRRTLGSSMAAAGVNTITTARTLGHKTLTKALRYQQLGTDPRRAAIEAGAGAILEQAGARESAEVINLKKR